MSIQLVTYANQTVTPTNDAIIYEKAVDQNGIFYGCNVTVTSNNVNITGGYGIVCGREFVINSESIAVTLAPSGTLEGRLYVRLDLADADAPIQLLTATGNVLPPLVQDDDVNYTNGTYEMELATFTVGVSSLSDAVETFEEIKGVKEILANMLEQTELKKLLWTNANPTSTFSGQTVPLDLSDYNAVDVVAVASLTSGKMGTCRIYFDAPVAQGLYLLGDDATKHARDLTLYSDRITFQNGYYQYMASGSSKTTDSGQAIPYKIYGVKLPQ